MSEKEATKDWAEREGRPYDDDDPVEPMTLMDWLQFVLSLAVGVLLAWCIWWIAYVGTHPVTKP